MRRLRLLPLNELDGFLYSFDLALVGNQPYEKQGQEGAEGLDAIQDPQVLQVVILHTHEHIDQVTQHLSREAIGEIHQAGKHSEHARLNIGGNHLGKEHHARQSLERIVE